MRISDWSSDVCSSDLVDGNQSAATGLTTVASGATLGGIGTIGGDVNVAAGGALAAGSYDVGTLSVNGSLSLAGTSLLDYEFGQSNIVGGPLNDLVSVGGDLKIGRASCRERVCQYG